MASCSAALVMITSWVSKSSDWSYRLYIQNRACLLIFSCINLSMSVLEKDTNGWDYMGDAWANIPPIPVYNGEVLIKIFPTNSKIDINLMFSSRKDLSQRVERAVAKIFASHGIGSNMLRNIKGWVKKDMNYNVSLSKSQYPFYPPRGKVFYSLKEIDFVKGASNFSETFHNYFTVNGSSKININFASKQVLEAYLPELESNINDLLSYRKIHPFKNITQLRNITGITDRMYLRIQPFITTQSHIFAVVIKIDIDGYSFRATGIVKKGGKRAILIKYFEGKGFYE